MIHMKHGRLILEEELAILEENERIPDKTKRKKRVIPQIRTNDEEREWWEMNREMEGNRRTSIRGKLEEDPIFGNEKIG